MAYTTNIRRLMTQEGDVTYQYFPETHWKAIQGLREILVDPSLYLDYMTIDEIVYKVTAAGELAKSEISKNSYRVTTYANTIISKMDADAQKINTYADTKIKEYNAKFTATDDKMKLLNQSQTDLAGKVDDTAKKIADNNILTQKDKFTSGDVLDTLTGATKATFEEEFLIDGDSGVGSIYVKDLGIENQIVNNNQAINSGLPYHRNMTYASISNISTVITDRVKVTVTSVPDPYYRPVGTNSGDVLKPNTAYTIAFNYKTMENASIRLRRILGDSTIQTYISGEGREALSFTTGPEGTRQYISLDPFKGTPNNPTTAVGDWFEFWDLDIVEGTFTELSHRPAPEDYGIVHGQPNLLDGTSNEWEEVTFTSWDTGENTVPYDIPLSQIGKIGDALTIISEIDNTSSSECYTKIQTLDINKSLITESGSKRIPANTKGFSQGSLKIPENTVYIRWKKASKTDSTNKVTVKVRGHKLIQGVGNAMDGYTPSQADSGLTPINNGMVPFSEAQNAAIASETGVVRSETLMVGRGAEIQFDFDVVGTLEKRHPFLFKGLTTYGEKAKKIDALTKDTKLKYSARGSGVKQNVSVDNFAKPYLKNANREKNWYGYMYSDSSSFVEKVITLIEVHKASLFEGIMTFKIVTKFNNSDSAADNGLISDGITPAWVEVKDISLQVTLEIDGKTIVETLLPDQKEGNSSPEYGNNLNWIAHRGNNTEYPENSIPAFENAKRHWGIETDIHLTSDGKWVVMHDETVDRTTNGTGAITGMTLAQFRALRIDTGTNLATLTDAEKTPPTLEEFLAICKNNNKVPIIEFKATSNYTVSQLQSFKTILSNFGFTNNVVLISFSLPVLKQLRSLFPDTMLQYLFNDTLSNSTVDSTFTALGLPCALSVKYNNTALTSSLVNYAHSKNMKVGVWTVPDTNFDAMKKLLVDYITTNSLSGNLRYQALPLLNGFTNHLDVNRLKESYVEELGNGVIHLDFNVADGVLTQNSAIATLPDWATPMYRQFAQCTVRTATGVEIATFDINGRLTPESATTGTLGVGLGWANKISWAAGSTNYKI